MLTSWFLQVAPEMVTLELEPTSKQSVLCPPPLSPALLSMLALLIFRPVAPLTLKTWTGVFLMLMLLMDEVPSRLWA
jgi:hypothetical protein